MSVEVQDYQGAIDYADELQNIARAGGMVEQLAHAGRWKGKALIRIKDYQSAENNLQHSLELATKIGALRCSWDIHTSFARLYREQGKNEEAEEHEESSKQIISRIADNLVSKELRTGFSKSEGHTDLHSS